jgi:hypothetical protein
MAAPTRTAAPRRAALAFIYVMRAAAPVAAAKLPEVR